MVKVRHLDHLKGFPMTTRSTTTKGCMCSAEAAAFLGISPKTLNNYRFNSKGPKYSKFGKFIVYRMEDLIDYLNKHTVDPSKVA